MDARLLRILDNREQNYPVALERQFPRIFSQIMSLWGLPGIEDLFSELLVSKRDERAGFPQDVADDIIYLSMVHARQRGKNQVDHTWGHVSDRFRAEIEAQGFPFSQQGFINAAESGKVDIIGLFLSSGADVDILDDRVWTPLMIASCNGSERAAKLLIKSGANVNHQDGAGYSPLHWAAFYGFSKIVGLLLKKHANVDAHSNHGWTPLMQAATRGHLSVSLMLMEHGANVNAVSKDGWTALHKASANGHFPVVKLLLSKGADNSIQHREAGSAYDLAIKNNHEQVASILYAS
ncbi:MAG: ankyrin repeat domain-containing protein [Gallionella sp.]